MGFGLGHSVPFMLIKSADIRFEQGIMMSISDERVIEELELLLDSDRFKLYLSIEAVLNT